MAIAQTFFSRGVQNGGFRTDNIPLAHSWGNSTQNKATLIPVGGTFSNLIVRTLDAQPAGGTITWTVFKNNVATAMTVTINDSGTYFEDVTHSVHFDAGDKFHFRAVTNAAVAATIRLSMDWEPDIDNVSLYASRVNTFAPDPLYSHLYEGCSGATGCSTATLGEAAEAYACVAGEIIGIGVTYTNALGPGGTLTIIKDSTLQDGSGGTPDSRLQAAAGFQYALSTSEGITVSDPLVYLDNTAQAVPFAELDRFAITATGDEPRVWCVAFKADEAGRWNMGGNTSPQTQINLTSALNYRPPHAAAETNSSVEADVLYTCGPTSFTVDGLWARVSPSPTVGKSVIVTVYKNSLPTALTVTIADTDEEASIDQELTFEEGDTFSIEQHSSGTPSSNVSPLRWTFLGLHIGGEVSPGESPSPASPDEEPERTPPTVADPSPDSCPCPPPGEGGAPGGGGGTPPGDPGNSGTNPGGEGWTPGEIEGCSTGGTVNEYETAEPGESMANVRDPRTWMRVGFVEFADDDSATDAPEDWALDATMPDAPHETYGARKAGNVYTLSPITRGMSDDNGNYVGSRVTAQLNDKQRDILRTRLGTDGGKYVWDREVTIYVASEANRRSGYTLDDPRTLHRGLSYDIELIRGFNSAISSEDSLVSQFGAFGPDRSFSTRLLTLGLFPGLPRDLVGKPQQWIFGEVSDEGAENVVTGEISPKGLVPLWLVGSLGSEDEYHLAAHDIGGLTLYGSDGATPPKRAPLTEGSDYRVETLDVVDTETGLTHRVTHVYLPTGSTASEAHKAGGVTLAANVCGKLGANGQTISDLFLIYQAVFELIVLPTIEYHTGTYPAGPFWADGRAMIHSDSFTDAQEFSIERIGGAGYQGGFVLGGPANGAVTLRELLRRMSNSGDCWFTWTSAGQLKCVLLDDTTDVESTPILREPARLRAMPTPRYALEEVENPVLYGYDWDDDKQRYRVPQARIINESALIRMGRSRPSPQPIEMRCVRDHMTARDVASRRLLRRQYPPAYVEVVEPIDGVDRDPGDIIRITSQEGPGTGYNEQPVFIKETTYDPNTRRTTHICRDLSPIIQGFGEWASLDVTWDTATDEQQAEFAFWANDDDLIPTELVPGQEWR